MGIIKKNVRFNYKYEDMENSIGNFSENTTGFAESENQLLDFFPDAVNLAGPGDEETDEGEPEVSDEDAPPLDPTIVHSPVPPQTGGKPPLQP